jgi:hypothetical protein
MKKGIKRGNLPREAKKELLKGKQKPKQEITITEGCIKEIKADGIVCPTGKAFSDLTKTATMGKSVEGVFDEFRKSVNRDVYESESLRNEMENVSSFMDVNNQLCFAFNEKKNDYYFECVMRDVKKFLRTRRSDSILKNLLFVIYKIYPKIDMNTGKCSESIIQIDPNEIVRDGEGNGWYTTNQKAFEGLSQIVDFLLSIKIKSSGVKKGKKSYFACDMETNLIRAKMKIEEVKASSIEEALRMKPSKNSKKYLAFQIEDSTFDWRLFFSQFDRIPKNLLSICTDKETHLLIELVRDIRMNVRFAKNEHGRKILRRKIQLSVITDNINISSPEYRETFQGKKNVSRYKKEVIETIEGLNEKCKKVGFPLYVYLRADDLLKDFDKDEDNLSGKIPNVSSKKLYQCASLYYEAKGKAIENPMEMKKRQRAHKQEAKRRAIAKNKAKDGNKS